MQRATALSKDGTPLQQRPSRAPAAARPPKLRRGWGFMAVQAVLYYMVMGLLCKYYFGDKLQMFSTLPNPVKPVQFALYRWRTGADADGWLPCDGRCDWGEQRRYVNGREQRRRCYGSGFVTADGECIMA